MPIIRFDSEWLKANVNVEQGDSIRFMDAGHYDEKDEQWIFRVAVVSNGIPVKDKKFSLNKTNHKSIVAAYGENSDQWVGKEMTVVVIQAQNPSGELTDAVRLKAPAGSAKDDIIVEEDDDTRPNPFT